MVARLRPAIAYAQRQHVGQRRTVDGAPFIVHPLEVAAVLHSAAAPERAIAAGLLHDTLEKTDATAQELREHFGAAVTAIVEAVSEDEQIADYSQRKAALRGQVAAAGSDALMVFAADKVSKVRELRRAASTPAAAWPAGSPPLELRLDHYRQCLELVAKRLDGSPLVDWLATELQRLIAATGERRVCASAVAPAAGLTER